MGNQQERRDAAVYLAAMIQGEGSVMLNVMQNGGRNRTSTSVQARVVIYNTDAAVLDEVQRYCHLLDAGEYRRSDAPRPYGWQKKAMGSIMVNGYKRLARFLPEIVPFLVGEKRERAEKIVLLSQARSTVAWSTPYEAWQWEIVKSFGKNRERLESSQTNMPSAAFEAVKIEPGPLARALGGESVSEYPALTAAS